MPPGGLGQMETPVWFQPGYNDEEAPQEQPKVEDSVLDMEKKDVVEEQESLESSSSFCCGRCKAIFFCLMSAILLGFFIYSTIVQQNDPDKYEWSVFYGLHAAIPTLFLVHYVFCFPDKFIYALSGGMAVWSIVQIILISVELENASGEIKVQDAMGGSNEEQTEREEYIYELAGVSLGLFSALHHSFMMFCCVNKDNKKE